MLAKKTSKNQLTLPKDIVSAFPNTDYFDATVQDKKIILTPVKITPVGSSLEEIRMKMERLGIKQNDVADAVRWARKIK